jgi:hypothetical protein
VYKSGSMRSVWLCPAILHVSVRLVKGKHLGSEFLPLPPAISSVDPSSLYNITCTRVRCLPGVLELLEGWLSSRTISQAHSAVITHARGDIGCLRKVVEVIEAVVGGVVSTSLATVLSVGFCSHNLCCG